MADKLVIKSLMVQPLDDAIGIGITVDLAVRIYHGNTVGVGRHCDQQEKPGHQKRNHRVLVADHERPAAIYVSIENLIPR